MRRSPFRLVAVFLLTAACGPNGGGAEADGSSSGGASPAAGGTAAGGTATSGGAPALGGATGSSGAAASGGVGTAAGGTTASGGAAASGGSGGTTESGASGGMSASGGRGAPAPVTELPRIEEMPDPLVMNDGTPVTTSDQWRARRQEMIQLLEDYEYGHMPPPPGNVRADSISAVTPVTVSGTLEADYRQVHLSLGPESSLKFDVGIFTPTSSPTGGTKFPLLVSLASSTSDKSAASAAPALSRGYAVATVPYQALAADSADWQKSPFFQAYPDYDWRDISAWAWGLSRAIDYLVTDPAVDADKIIITGVSRLAQAVLLAGAFDERVALSAPVAGGAALRFSGKEMGGGLGQGITEVVDQNTYWFGPLFPQFRNQTPKLPSDQHWLLALTAPRLFIMCNSLSDQYGRAFAAVQTYVYAKPTYDFLSAENNVGLHFREGTHGMTAEDWSALLDFSDQFLLKLGGDRKFDIIPPKDKLP